MSGPDRKRLASGDADDADDAVQYGPAEPLATRYARAELSRMCRGDRTLTAAIRARYPTVGYGSVAPPLDAVRVSLWSVVAFAHQRSEECGPGRRPCTPDDMRRLLAWTPSDDTLFLPPPARGA